MMYQEKVGNFKIPVLQGQQGVQILVVTGAAVIPTWVYYTWSLDIIIPINKETVVSQVSPLLGDASSDLPIP